VEYVDDRKFIEVYVLYAKNYQNRGRFGKAIAKIK